MRDSRDLDIALAAQTLEIEIGQTECHTKFDRKGTLGGSAISIELVEEQKVSLSL
jgi:hypothetical protein